MGIKETNTFFQKYLYSYKKVVINSIVSRREYDYTNVISLNSIYSQMHILYRLCRLNMLLL